MRIGIGYDIHRLVKKRKLIIGGVEIPYDKGLTGHDVFENAVDPDSGEIIVEAGKRINRNHAKKIREAGIENVKVIPFLTDEIVYMSADEEDRYTIAQANAELDERRQFVGTRISARRNQQFRFSSVGRIDFMDVAPRQIVGDESVVTALLQVGTRIFSVSFRSAMAIGTQEWNLIFL